MTRTKKLLFYIAFQVFAIIFLVISYLSIQNKENVVQYDPVSIVLANQQIARVGEIQAGIELISLMKDKNKTHNVLELVFKISDWEKGHMDLIREIENSEMGETSKKNLIGEMRHAYNYLNRIELSTRIIIQKPDAPNVVKSLKEVVAQNEAGYVSEMKDVIHFLKKHDEHDRNIADIKEQIVFFLALSLVVLNVIVLVTPLRRYILD
jgi:hypothetical protein